MPYNEWPSALATYFDFIEQTVRSGLAEARTKKDWYRKQCFMYALMKLTLAREEFSKCPEGARLAYLGMEAQLNQLAPDRESEIKRLYAAEKGLAKAPAAKRKKTVTRHQRIRALAAKLKNPKLKSHKAKAEALARKTTKLSVRQIRKILAKKKDPRK